MRAILVLIAIGLLASDIARVYAAGQEPAQGGKDLDVPKASGKELAHIGNQHLGRNYGDLAR